MKNVLITGAGIGIGKATALTFAHSGYHVFVSDILSTEGQQVTEEIASAGGSAQYIHLDVTDPASVSSAMTEIGGGNGQPSGLYRQQCRHRP